MFRAQSQTKLYWQQASTWYSLKQQVSQKSRLKNCRSVRKVRSHFFDVFVCPFVISHHTAQVSLQINSRRSQWQRWQQSTLNHQLSILYLQLSKLSKWSIRSLKCLMTGTSLSRQLSKKKNVFWAESASLPTQSTCFTKTESKSWKWRHNVSEKAKLCRRQSRQVTRKNQDRLWTCWRLLWWLSNFWSKTTMSSTRIILL